MSTAKEGHDVKVGQVWVDEEGTQWTIKYVANRMLAMTEAPPAYPARTCICGDDTPRLDGWKLITEAP